MTCGISFGSSQRSRPGAGPKKEERDNAIESPHHRRLQISISLTHVAVPPDLQYLSLINPISTSAISRRRAAGVCPPFSQLSRALRSFHDRLRVLTDLLGCRCFVPNAVANAQQTDCLDSLQNLKLLSPSPDQQNG
jgi:hypothetical protein